MLTDKCNAIIDEAITAGGDLTKLSAEATAHIETCLECRKSLESIKALKASAVSVIPLVASDTALKAKIASNLESAMAARRAASGSAVATKTTLGIGSVLLGVGLCGVIACGIVLSNKSDMAYKPIQDNSNKSTIEQIASPTVKTLVEKSKETKAKADEISGNNLSDVKDPEEFISQTIPPVRERK